MADAETLANFLAVTGATEAQAVQMLETTGWQLQEAVNLFFAAGPDALGGGGGGGGGGAPAGRAPAADEDDEAMARRLQAESRPSEEQVRAPDAARVERLYGDVSPMMPRRRANPVPHNVVDAFRDFAAEGSRGGAAGGGGLAALFEPPRELLFVGSLEEAKAAAAGQSRWLLVNVQSTESFASHQLNRDTWRNATVAELVENNFVLYQAYDVTEEGQKLVAFYHVYELPATLVVDPITGAPVAHWTGFVSPDRLVEDLIPFLDTSFTDPGAARLAASLKRKKAGAGRAPAAAAPTAAAHDDGDEDEQLRRAIEASMAQQRDAAGAGPSGAAAGGAGPSAPTGPAAPPARPAAEVAAEAEARLPPEPPAGEGARIAIRFPDGQRGVRRFPLAATVRALRDFCEARVEEAAAGRPFVLTGAFPGAPALADDAQTLEAARVADAMLVMKWSD